MILAASILSGAVTYGARAHYAHYAHERWAGQSTATAAARATRATPRVAGPAITLVDDPTLAKADVDLGKVFECNSENEVAAGQVTVVE